MTSTKHLCGPLARLLSPHGSYQSLPHAILAILEGLLYDEQGLADDQAEHEDRAELLTAPVAMFPVFLEELTFEVRGNLRMQMSILPLLRRVVRIFGCLCFYHQGSLLKIDIDHITHIILQLLLYVFEHLLDAPSSDRANIRRTVYGTVCKIAILQARGPRDSPVEEFMFDDGQSEAVADAVVSVLQTALSVPAETLKTLLSLIAVSSCEHESDDDSEATILSHLREPSRGVVELLKSLQDHDKYGSVARDAMMALQASMN
ncbi:hypothetical protein AcW1_006367 [Taiwanofungus camphoratus]|nr:hypothetical protein AcW1_006367 [Antrodia cinnamomea]